KGMTLKDPPSDIGLSLRMKGFRPSLEAIEIHKECLFHRYGDPPAIVSATFDNGSRLDIYIAEPIIVHAVVIDRNGKEATTRLAVEKAAIPKVSILPQIGPVSVHERILSDEYVRRS